MASDFILFLFMVFRGWSALVLLWTDFLRDEMDGLMNGQGTSINRRLNVIWAIFWRVVCVDLLWPFCDF
jgi:hypothetical protein